MKIKAVNGFARTLKSEGVPWVSCYPTSPVNNALGEEGVPILMMGEERFAVAVADGFSRVTCGKQIGVCTVMAGLNAAGIQMAYGAVAQAWEDSSPLLVIAEGVGPGATRHTHYDIGPAFKSVTKWVGEIDRADLVPDYVRRAFTHLRSGRPGPVLLLVPRGLGEYDEAEHPYAPVKGWRTGPDPDDVKTAVKVLLAARDPLLHIGEGVLYADATGELLKFAELAQLPVLTTLKAKGAFPENHPLAVARIERDADQPVPGARRPHEGARSQELVRHRGFGKHAGPDEHRLRDPHSARLPRLGQRLDARLQSRRGGGGQAGLSESSVRP